MKYKNLLVTLFFKLVLITNLFSQAIKTGQILELSSHPTDNTLFIAKIYDSNKLLRDTWEMSTSQEGITVSNYNDLLGKGIVFPNGKHVRYNKKMGVEMEENFSYGLWEGEMKAYLPTGQLKLSCTFSNNYLDGELINYFPNGNEQHICGFSKGLKTGNEVRYFENGKIHYRSVNKVEKDFTKFEVYNSKGKIKSRTNIPNSKFVIFEGLNDEVFKSESAEFISELDYVDGIDTIFTLISHLELPGNISTKDTIYPTIVFSINKRGGVESINTEFISDTILSKYLINWAKGFEKFSPPSIDSYTWRSLFGIQMMFINGKHVKNIRPKKLNSFSVNDKIYEVEELIYYSYKDGSPFDPDKQTFFIVEKMPEFPGGELAMRRFIAEKLTYPVQAQEKGIQGKVFVTFVINKMGEVVESKIARGVHSLLDAEALRVISSMPVWTPGTQKGIPARVSYTVPVSFIIR